MILITYFGWVPVSCEECEFVHDLSSPPPFPANIGSEETETLPMASLNGDSLVTFTFIGQFFKGLYAQKPDYSEPTLTWSKPLPLCPSIHYRHGPGRCICLWHHLLTDPDRWHLLLSSVLLHSGLILLLFIFFWKFVKYFLKIIILSDIYIWYYER